MFLMDAQTQLKLDVIAKVVKRKISIKNAAKILNKSRRTIERYISAYNSKGVSFVLHGNTGNMPANKSSKKTKKKVQKLIREKYYDFNLQHLSEILESNESLKIKRETLRTWAHEIHHVKRFKKRRSQVRKRRDRMESAGLLLQMDGSPHLWFGKKKSCLIAIIDDATSDLYGEFFPSETTLGCMKVLRDYIINRGIFKTLYVDRAGIFGGAKRCNFSQVQRACNELGIQIIFANSAEAKGRIERSFNTLQDRLIPELRLNKIKTMDKANEYLQGTFIPNYWNKKLTVKAESPSEFKRVYKRDVEMIKSVFTCKDYRKINKNHTFSYEGKLYEITDNLKTSLAGYKIEIRTDLRGEIGYFHKGEMLAVRQVKSTSIPDRDTIEVNRRLRAVKLAKKLKSATKASRETGVSRQVIYRTMNIIDDIGEKEFISRCRLATYVPNKKKTRMEETVVKFSLKNPHLGEAQTSLHLKEKYNIEISRGTVRNIWLKNDIETIGKRLHKKGKK